LKALVRQGKRRGRGEKGKPRGRTPSTPVVRFSKKKKKLPSWSLEGDGEGVGNGPEGPGEEEKSWEDWLDARKSRHP